MPQDTLEAQLGDALTQKGWTICTAESCTGGLVAHRITNVAGSSHYMLGGVVAYANEIKEGILGVQTETLLTHGAVSEATAAEMARGALRVFDADMAVSITGIAGPGGGTPEKPVGLTFIGVATRAGLLSVQRHVWPGDREDVKNASARAALQLALDTLRVL